MIARFFGAALAVFFPDFSSGSAASSSSASSSLLTAPVLVTASTTNGGSRYGSICLNLEINCRNSAVDASSQLITCSDPCELTNLTSHRLCSSSKTASTLLNFRSFCSRFSSFSSFSIFFGGSFLSPSKSACFEKSIRGRSSVTLSSRRRLFTLSKKLRYSFSTLINRVRFAPSSLAAPSP